MVDSLVTNSSKKSQRVAYETMADHLAFVTQIQSPHDEISEQAIRSWSTNSIKYPEDTNGQYIHTLKITLLMMEFMEFIK